MSRDKRGRFASPKPCAITRELGGYWCHTHRKWADMHDLVLAKKSESGAS